MIPRFQVPTLDDLAPLELAPDVAEKVRAVLAGEVDPRDVSPKATQWYRDCYHKPAIDGHDLALAACDDLLGTCGVVALNVEGAPYYTDEGIRMCPPFSYCNAGDTYAATLARDHAAGAWVVACWGDLLEEYEQSEEIGDWETFNTCPDYCPDCHGKTFSLEFFPGSARGPSYSWICDSCNHHCFAPSAEDDVPIGQDEDGHTVVVRARKPNGMPWRFAVHLEGVETPCPDYLPPRGETSRRPRMHASASTPCTRTAPSWTRPTSRA